MMTMAMDEFLKPYITLSPVGLTSTHSIQMLNINSDIHTNIFNNKMVLDLLSQITPSYSDSMSMSMSLHNVGILLGVLLRK